MRLSIVIPSRDGLDHLGKNLPGVLGSGLPEGTEILVVDDCSEDPTYSEGPRLFPGVRFVRRTGDPGFCHAVNLGMSEASGDFLLLLNNDVVPRHGAFAALCAALSGAPAWFFASVPVILRPDGTDESRVVFTFRHGLASTTTEGEGTPYPSGACSLWRRSSWEELGGLDTDYAPIYWEDTDIGARAFQKGWRLLRVEYAEVLHDHAATMGHTTESEALRERNRLLFTHRHFRRPPERISTMLWTPLHLLSALLTGNRAFLKGYRDFLAAGRGRQT